jgi:beta-xylosidase
MYLSSLVFALAALLPTVTRAYNNPISWQDLADVDIRNVNGTYYYSSSNFHYSPGAPILRSFDLVNWEMIGHSVPKLAQLGDQYSLSSPTNRAYRGGTWASWLDFNKFDGKWYWGGCINFWRTVIYTAPNPQGPWTLHADFQGSCFYDSGLLIDDDGTPYVSYKDTNIWVATLSRDFKTIVSKTQVYTLSSDIAAAEGTRPYKVNGQYYIFIVNPGVAEHVLRSSNILGSYTRRVLTSSVSGPITGTGPPVQGAIVKANSGQWYYMCFSWAFPIGRVPILAPLNWGSDGWPSVTVSNPGSLLPGLIHV